MLYPLFLDLRRRRCLVIGGGRVAERKARTLAASGARITVVAERAGAGITRLAAREGVRLIRRAFRPSDMKGMFLVMIATDDRALNHRAAGLARKRGALVNVADDPGQCDFYLPAVLRRGALQIAVCTGGSSPALAARIRGELGSRYGKEYAALLRIARGLRRRVTARLPERKRSLVLRSMAGPVILRRLRRDGIAGARREMEKIAFRAGDVRRGK